MDRLEKAMKLTMLTVGIAGIAVIYFGFFYLQYNAELGMTMPWYFLISPWVCVYFGLSEQQQSATIAWFTRKFTAKK
ncbi:MULTISPECIES: hypothetical protein [Shewanella]|uniref:Uncharacterized protein n=1 Tax=Shewanella japonica TaxID=93973 RepID=A0ABN4YLM3_9GAMM|nr:MULTISPECIES: hypothetical protein [Shewanella]ARD21807.1 hypothetical protein SJ2017_1488 [Shewanella japonica]KPZ72817.1 hypothetical protein AN944_00506 [Shewanella sp. P1-14-1]MBQ4888397.1 hypothetical protein [Shewanella sp. MMG014]OBT09238.1 hypothetical protein A9267_09575 [Shewanella sp. UCD-FRSSP16_17]